MHRALAVLTAASWWFIGVSASAQEGAPPSDGAPPPPPPTFANGTAFEAPPPGTPRMTFAASVHEALVRNPTARTADEEVRRAYGLMEQARASSLPTLYGVGTYTRLDSDRVAGPASLAPAGTVLAPRDAFNATATLAVPLINPRGWAAWSHASEQIDVQRANAGDVRRTLAITTGRGYLAIITQKRLLETSTRARDAAKAHFDYAHQRFVGGVGNKIDEVRAAQELATDESSVRSSLVGLVRAREALGVLVAGEQPVDTADEGLQGDAPPMDAAQDEARKHRADVLAAERRVRAAEHVKRDDWTDLSPYLSGVFAPFYQDPPSLTLPQTGWQAQVILTLPLYDGGLRYGQWRERDALLVESRVALEETLRQTRSDVRTAFESLQRADEAMQSARDAGKLANQALELANIAYRAGATTNIEVIDAEREARDADTAAAIAEDTARNARLDLLAATGRFPENDNSKK